MFVMILVMCSACRQKVRSLQMYMEAVKQLLLIFLQIRMAGIPACIVEHAS